MYLKALSQNKMPLEPVQTGSYQVLLTTATVVKLHGFSLWSHLSIIKMALAPDEETSAKYGCEPVGDLCSKDTQVLYTQRPRDP